jgi:hypothetical protein
MALSKEELWTQYVQLPKTSCGKRLSLGQSEKCAVVDEIVGAKHDIKFSSSCSLDKAASCADHMVKETANIKLHPNNFSKDEGFM